MRTVLSLSRHRSIEIALSARGLVDRSAREDRRACSAAWPPSRPRGSLARAQQAADRVMLVSVVDRNNRPTVDVGPDDFVDRGGQRRSGGAGGPGRRLSDRRAHRQRRRDRRRPSPRSGRRRRASSPASAQRPVAVGTLADPSRVRRRFRRRPPARPRSARQRSESRAGAYLRPLSAVTRAAADRCRNRDAVLRRRRDFGDGRSIPKSRPPATASRRSSRAAPPST